MSRVDRAVRWARWVLPAGIGLLLCTAALAKSTTVTTHQTRRGTDLAATTGHILYLFTADKAGRSVCTGACANVWLPLLTSGRPTAAKGSGVNAKLLGTIKRGGHTLQVTYNGHPLYLFAGDKRPGQISGEGANQYGGHWYIVNTAGNPVKPKSSGGIVCHTTCQRY
jgi:predicted lipoprotein with Yx(FWY)xxD motif